MEVLDQGFDRWATRICAPYKNVDDGNLNVYLCEGKKPHLVSLFHIAYQSTRLHHVFPYSLALLMCKDISPETFEKLTGLPEGYIQNVGDESGFMQDDMGAPDLIGFRNTKKHDEFIEGYVGRIMESLTLS